MDFASITIIAAVIGAVATLTAAMVTARRKRSDTSDDSDSENIRQQERVQTPDTHKRSEQADVGALPAQLDIQVGASPGKAIAARVDATGKVSYLVVLEGQGPRWVDEDAVTIGTHDCQERYH